MITNKDIRVENGFLIINGDKYPLDGQSPEAIMQIVEDNSDTTPTAESTAPVQSGGVYAAIGNLTQTGVTGATVAAQLGALEGKTLKVANVSATMTVSTADLDAIGGYRSVSQTSKVLSTFTGYPTGKVVVADSLHAYGANAATAAVVNVISGVVYLNAAKAADYTVEGVVFYHD